MESASKWKEVQVQFAGAEIQLAAVMDSVAGHSLVIIEKIESAAQVQFSRKRSRCLESDAKQRNFCSNADFPRAVFPVWRRKRRFRRNQRKRTGFTKIRNRLDFVIGSCAAR